MQMQQQMLMQQQMQMQMMQQMQIQQQMEMQNQLNENQYIKVIFKFYGEESQTIIVVCMPNEKISKVIERYRNKSLDRDTTEKFIFNSHVLNPSLTVAEAGMSDNSCVFVVATPYLKGG